MDAPQVDPIVENFHSGTWWLRAFYWGTSVVFWDLQVPTAQASRTPWFSKTPDIEEWHRRESGSPWSIQLEVGWLKRHSEIFKACNWSDWKIFHSGWMALILTFFVVVFLWWGERIICRSTGGVSCHKQKRRKCSEMRQNMGKARTPKVSNRTLLAKQKGEGVKCIWGFTESGKERIFYKKDFPFVS